MSTRSEDALISLRRIFRATEISSRNLAKASGLTTSQNILMQLLVRSQRLTPSEIAKEASFSQATVTALIDKLAARGLVSRQRDADDKRRVWVELTSEGASVVDSAPSILQDRFVSRFARLEDWEQALMIAVLERTARMLDAEDIDAAPILDVGPITETGTGSGN